MGLTALTSPSTTADPPCRLNALDTPVRRLRIICEAPHAFAFPALGTLEPYYVLRGLIGGALTAHSRELERALFKPAPLRDLGGTDHSEAPGTPWRLRLSHLYGREIRRRFEIVIDLLGEEPCDRMAELLDAVRLAGSGQPHRDWRNGMQRRWGMRIAAADTGPATTLTFAVVNVDADSPRPLRARCDAAVDPWREAREALLVFRTLTILRERLGSGRGTPLAATGHIDAAALVRNTLRRLAVLDVATRRDPAARRWNLLRAVVADQERVLAALAAQFPLRCLDAITLPLEWRIGRQRTLRGLIGSTRLGGATLEPWLAGLTVCEVLGVGESTSYGAGQVSCLPVS